MNRHEGESTNLKKMLSYEGLDGLQFCVDGAVGLPVSSTATRVTVRLVDLDHREFGDTLACTYSHPESDAFNPLFDLHLSWRGEPVFIQQL